MMQRGVPCAFGVTMARWGHRFCLGASFQFSGPFLVAAMNSPQPRATRTNAIIRLIVRRIAPMTPCLNE